MDQTAGNERARLTVPMVDPEIVKHLRALHALGWGTKRIARELGAAAKARAVTRGFGERGRREELAARPAGRARRADRPAIDAGRADADEEHAIEPRVAGENRLVGSVIGQHEDWDNTRAGI